MMIPAAIDSQGKPGTAGTTSGVVALDWEVTVTVTVPPEVDVLLDVPVDVLIEV
jgi:hypothetical protein